ncbi:hypothetical protein [Larkinella soli]|nr:hypothetical protein [Larkinella soli]
MVSLFKQFKDNLLGVENEHFLSIQLLVFFIYLLYTISMNFVVEQAY